MIGRIYAIGLNTFREAVRNLLLWVLAVLGVFSILFAVVLGEMSLHEQARVIRDVSLGSISFFGCLIAIVLGVWLLYTEINRRTIHTILAKPLQRYEFVLGKYVGMGITLAVVVLFFTAILALLFAFVGVPYTGAVAKQIVLSCMEIAVVAALAVFFSSFSTWLLSGLFSFCLFFIGRITPFMHSAIESTDHAGIRAICSGALYVVPDLHLFSVSGATVQDEYVSVHSDFVTWGYVATASLYAAFYVAVLLLLAVSIFSRRDFA